MLHRQAFGTAVRDPWEGNKGTATATGAQHFVFECHSWVSARKKEGNVSAQSSSAISPTSLAAEELLSRLPLSMQVFFFQPDLEWRGNLISSGSLGWPGNGIRNKEEGRMRNGIFYPGTVGPEQGKDNRDKMSFRVAWTLTGCIHFSCAGKSLQQGIIQGQDIVSVLESPNIRL